MMCPVLTRAPKMALLVLGSVVAALIWISPPQFAYAEDQGQSYKLEDYRSFWGVNGKTTREEIVQRFGNPETVFMNRYFYFNETLSFFFSSDEDQKVISVILEFTNPKRPPPNKLPGKIPPSVLDRAFIGKHVSAVLETFGPAHKKLTDTHMDGIEVPETALSGPSVWFTCYDFR